MKNEINTCNILFEKNQYQQIYARETTVIDFRVVVKNNNIELRWEVLPTTNTFYFEVFQSSDSIDFNIAGARAYMNGNLQYHFIDNNPYLGSNYYKIKFVDNNGRFGFSKIISINF